MSMVNCRILRDRSIAMLCLAQVCRHDSDLRDLHAGRVDRPAVSGGHVRAAVSGQATDQ